MRFATTHRIGCRHLAILELNARAATGTCPGTGSYCQGRKYQLHYIMQPMPVRIWSAFFFCSSPSAA